LLGHRRLEKKVKTDVAKKKNSEEVKAQEITLGEGTRDTLN
jgi:hypothetical protein